MSTLLNLLAVAGGAAAAWHLVRAASRFLSGGVSGIWAEEMARTHARTGDLTSLDEKQRERARTARSARWAAFEVVAWLGVLALPAFTAWPRAIYAGYTLLWAGPTVRQLRRVRGGT